MAVYGALSHLHKCHLGIQLEGSPETYSIAKRLVSDGMAWETCPKKPANVFSPIADIDRLIHPQLYTTSPSGKLLASTGDDVDVDVDVDEEQEEGDYCEDIFVLDVIGGHYFFAYVGVEALHMVQSISDLLLSELPALRTLTPAVGDLVAVVQEEDGAGGGVGRPPGMMRGRVIEMGDDEVTVFAVDYGTIRKVKASQVYELAGSATCLANFDAQAKVCCLAGGFCCCCLLLLLLMCCCSCSSSSRGCGCCCVCCVSCVCCVCCLFGCGGRW